jgi:hypothetical protein
LGQQRIEAMSEHELIREDDSVWEGLGWAIMDDWTKTTQGDWRGMRSRRNSAFAGSSQQMCLSPLDFGIAGQYGFAFSS